jgi:hypothetical protein
LETAIRCSVGPPQRHYRATFVSIITLQGLSMADNDLLGADVQQCDIAKKFVRATKHTPNVNHEGANQTE